MDERDQKVKALPVLIGPKNAEAVTGFPWRWCRDRAAQLGVPFIGAGKKRGMRADLFVAALESVSTSSGDIANNATNLSVDDAAAQVRALLGKRVRA